MGTAANGPEDASKSSFPNSLTPPDNDEGEHEPRITLDEARAALAGKRIVIVEDEGVTQMQLRRTLAHSGLVIAATAINGRDGVTAVLHERPDIVLMDIRMPVMDGVEAMRQIMAEYTVCIIMLTAFSDEEYREQTYSLGASGYIIKPITSDLLLPLMLKAYRRFQQNAAPQNEVS